MNSAHHATQIDTIIGRQPTARSLYKMDYNPKDYLKPSAARVKLAGRVFGGLPRRKDIDKLKKQLPHLRVRSGAWQELAAKCLREAAVAGEISVYLFNASESDTSETSLPPILSPDLVRRLNPVRGGIPDHPYRVQPSLMRDGLVTPELFAALQTGILLYRREEFESWCRSELQRGLWPSQHSSEKPKPGRPTKKTNLLRSRIFAAIERDIWTADKSVMELHRILVDQGYGAVPSHDTLARLVDELHLETGDQKLRRTIRRRRR